MIFGAELVAFGILFLYISIAAIIGALFGIFYAITQFNKNRIKSISIFILSAVVIVTVCIFWAKPILPKPQIDMNFNFEEAGFYNSGEIGKLCKKLSGLEGSYYCSSSYSYNLNIHLPDGTDYKIKSINLGFTINHNSSKLEYINFYNKEDYSLNELKEYFKSSSFDYESPVPQKISTGILLGLSAYPNSASAECENKPEYRICITASSLGGDYSLGYEVSKRGTY